MTKLRSAKLINRTVTYDELNQPTETDTAREVVVEVRSVTQSEYFAGRQGGLTPDLAFLLSVFDYEGEKVIEYNGQKFEIYRTYEDDDNYVELYAQVAGGITNAPEPTPEPEPTPDPEEITDNG